MVELLFLPLLLYLFTGGECSQECYVCRPPEEMSSIAQKVLHQFPNQELPICGRDSPSPKFCPHNYNGCLTQFHGELVVRLCGELKITACEVANGVEYCYCDGQLCNTVERRKHPARTATGDSRVDDEDSEEDGSGSGVMPPGAGGSVVEVPESPEHHPASSAAALVSTVYILALVLPVF